ncbi:hypothetical protein AVEN_57580-1 [Araneus ventricosus]|uniref:Uncharacterized protein n=1 Tax=Araneus ventricosus TaxID=182803 RepID=A0A4Y2P913_ARAVE|nr:hypothetical protein AVEN_57580-1 [Araneus ventricosus]
MLSGSDSTFHRFVLESHSGRAKIWREQGTIYHQSNIVERHNYRRGGIMVWAGISFGGHIDLNVLYRRILTAVRIKMRSSIHMTHHTLMLLVKNSSKWLIMLDFTEINLSRNILSIKVWGDWISQINLLTLILYNPFGAISEGRWLLQVPLRGY